MSEPSRGLQISRRGWLLAGLLAPLFPARGANTPIVTFDGDNLHISSLGIHFLRGNSLSRLKDGATVEYVATVGLYRDQFATLFRRSERHFLVSYDIWGTGDVFAVSTDEHPSRGATNLSLSATETWCLERVVISTGGMARDQQFWLQLELKTVPPKLSSILQPGGGTAGLHVNVIEVLTPGQDERQIFRTAEPIRLEDLLNGLKKRGGRAG
jgi:hypothetical protein